MDNKRWKVFNAQQGQFGSQWLNVVPCKNLGLKRDDQRGNGYRTKKIEPMELGLTCSKFLKSSYEIELISYFLKQELELICYGNWNLKKIGNKT